MTIPESQSAKVLTELLTAERMSTLHDEATRKWHAEPLPEVVGVSFANGKGGIYELALAQHAANFKLWHTEDEARRPEASDAELARVKRSIDRTNQIRNDLAERCDEFLLEALAEYGLPRGEAELNSESPGLMIDRLSILALKIFHTAEEINRRDAGEMHGERNRNRLAVLVEQRKDLCGALDRLWQQSLAGTRRFKLYRQLKMYNDPTLNPAVYGGRKEPST
jgi:hypothetical protein